jgi:RND family efflux transporter MFP subunit
VVAQLDDDEFVQALAQARADLEVARAKRIEAQSALETARRDLKRIRTLRERGVASESQLDAVLAEETARNAALEVAKSQVVRAEATVRTAEIRLGYTRVTADWSGGGDRRVVAERHVDEGETVSANAALLRIVELAPLTGVFFVTEKNYALLHPGQAVSLTTDAFPGESFAGRISRIAPVFQSETRQARVEVEVDNKDLKLKPGMFIRASVALAHKNEATLVPEQAITTRDRETGLFLIDASGASVSWRTVETGIHAEGLVEVMDPHLSGDVVVMGHQLLVDGAAVLRVEEFPSAAGDLQQAPQL